MKGKLFGDCIVELDDRTPDMGGSFLKEYVHGNVATAYDVKLIEFVHGRLQAIARKHPPLMIDIGASTGSFALLAKFVEVERVLAFEPNPPVCEVLRSNVKLNDLTHKITVYEAAVADRAGHTLKVPTNAQYGFATLGVPVRFEEYRELAAQVATFDMVAEHTPAIKEWGRIDLIKSDANGADILVMRGGETAIKKYKPEIVFEYAPSASAQFATFDEIVDLLRGWGYGEPQLVGHEDWWMTC